MSFSDTILYPGTPQICSGTSQSFNPFKNPEQVRYVDPETGRVYCGDEALYMSRLREEQERRRPRPIQVNADWGGIYPDCSTTLIDTYCSTTLTRIQENDHVLTEGVLHRAIDILRNKDKDLCPVCNKKHSDAQLKLIKYKYKLYKSLLPDNPDHDMNRFEGMTVCAALKEIKSLLHKK